MRHILSKLSNSDREALDKLMNDKTSFIDVNKRELLKRNFENNYHLNKRNNFKIHCKGLNCEEYDDIPDNKEAHFDEDTYNQCPGT